MHLTPEILHAAYEYFLVCPPFRGTKMPPADSVVFRVVKTEDPGVYNDPPELKEYRGQHVIDISCKKISHTDTLMRLMLHEMCHMLDYIQNGKCSHSAEWTRLKERAARVHGFDPKEL